MKYPFSTNPIAPRRNPPLRAALPGTRFRAGRLLLVLLALIFGVALPGVESSALASQKATKTLGGDFELLDTEGKAFKLSSLRGKVVLVYFGYTGCPDACPTDMMLFKDVLERLGGRREMVQPLFISVDPGRDKPEHLVAYVDAFSPAIRALTGTERNLRKVAKAYGAHFSYVGRTPNSTTYTVDHSVSVYVVNRKGRLVGAIPFGTPLDEVIRRIEGVLDQPD